MPAIDHEGRLPVLCQPLHSVTVVQQYSTEYNTSIAAKLSAKLSANMPRIRFTFVTLKSHEKSRTFEQSRDELSGTPYLCSASP